MSATAFGVIAAVIILASYVLRGETKIRIVNLVGNVFLVLFAINLHHDGNATFASARIILLLLGVAAVFVHVIHLWNGWKEKKSKKAVANAEARAAQAEAKIDEQLNISAKPTDSDID